MRNEQIDDHTDPIFSVLADFVEKQRAQRAMQDECACRTLPPQQDDQAAKVYGSFISAYMRLVQTRPTSSLGARDLLDWAIEELEGFHQLDRGATFWPALYLVRQFLEQQAGAEEGRTAASH